jgi:hypothetical protein
MHKFFAHLLDLQGKKLYFLSLLRDYPLRTKVGANFEVYVIKSKNPYPLVSLPK